MEVSIPNVVKITQKTKTIKGTNGSFRVRYFTFITEDKKEIEVKAFLSKDFK